MRIYYRSKVIYDFDENDENIEKYELWIRKEGGEEQALGSTTDPLQARAVLEGSWAFGNTSMFLIIVRTDGTTRVEAKL